MKMATVTDQVAKDLKMDSAVCHIFISFLRTWATVTTSAGRFPAEARPVVDDLEDHLACERVDDRHSEKRILLVL
jgi:hypothetical protein